MLKGSTMRVPVVCMVLAMHIPCCLCSTVRVCLISETDREWVDVIHLLFLLPCDKAAHFMYLLAY
jgi:hypothetical protein